MSSTSKFTDGDFDTRSLAGPTRKYYPFLNAPTKDTTTKFFERIYSVDRASYTPFAAGTTLPDEGTSDPADASAIILKEDEPNQEVDGTQEIKCLFGYKPIDQVQSGSTPITRPTAAAAGGLTSATTQLLWASSALITYEVYTTYQNYLFAPTAAKIYGALATTTSANSGGNTRITWTAHGLAGTETLAVAIQNSSAGQFVLFASGTYTIVDANTIQLTGVNYGTNSTLVGKFRRNYTAGPGIVRTRETTKFYMPGDIIPAATTALSDVALLASVIANATGYTPYSETRPTQWEGTCMLAVTYTEILQDDL